MNTVLRFSNIILRYLLIIIDIRKALVLKFIINMLKKMREDNNCAH